MSAKACADSIAEQSRSPELSPVASKQAVCLQLHQPTFFCVTSVLQFALDDRSATVQLGTTTAMAAITAELTTPYNDRAREGSVK